MEEERTEELYSPAKFTIQESPLPFIERNGFPHWLMAIVWVLVAFVSFNIVGGIVGIIAAIIITPDFTDIEALITNLSENVDILFLANSSGQIFVMGLGTLVFVKMSAVKGQRREFLRLKITKQTGVLSILAVVLIVAVYPTVNFLGWLNSFVPAPQALLDMQQSMSEMISKFLQSENVLLLGLFHIGVVPAVCEEIMYRGYVQRSLEKSGGVWAAILISGFIFGAYHLQINNLLPLAFLGIILAYITYISDSIIPAMFAHFANNGGQVIASFFYPEMLDETITPETEMPWMLILISVVVSAGLLFLLNKMKETPQT